MIYKETYEKKFILIFSSDLLKSSIDIRKPYHPWIENYVLMMNPTVRELEEPTFVSPTHHKKINECHSMEL